MAFKFFFKSILVFLLSGFLAIGCQEKSLDTSNVEPTDKVVDSVSIYIADSIYNRAKALFGERKFEEARALFKKSDSAFKTQERYREYVMSKRNEAVNLLAMFAPDEEILAVLREGIDATEKVSPYDRVKGVLFLSVGHFYSRTGHYPDARFYGERALEIFSNEANNDHPDQQQEIYEAYDHLASCELMLYNYEKAEYYYKEIINTASNQGLRTRMMIDLIGFYQISNQLEKAQTLLDTTAWEQRLANTSFFEKFNFELNKLDYYKKKEDFGQALVSVKRLQDLIESTGFREHFSEWFLNSRIYEMHYSLGDYQKVVELIESVKPDEAKGASQTLSLAKDAYWLSMAYNKLGNTDKVESGLIKAINTHLPATDRVEGFFDTASLDNALHRFALINKLWFKASYCSEQYETSGDPRYYEEALENYNLVHLLLKELGAESREDSFLQEVELEKFYEEYISFLFGKWSSDSSKDVFYEALTVADEFKQLVVLQELLSARQDKVFSNIPKQYTERIEYFQNTLDSLTLAINETNENSAVLELVKDSVAREFTVFREDMKQAQPRYYRLLYGGEVAAEQLLSEKFTTDNFLEYFMGEGHIYVFNRKGDEVRFDRIDYSAEINDALRTLDESFREPGNEGLEARSAVIYDALVAPYISEGDRLVLVLDGALHGIPFEALRNESGFLVETNNVLRINSLLQDYGAIEPQKTRALAFAPFANRSSSQWESISGSLDEVRKVKEFYGGEVHIDVTAGKQQFLEQAPNFPIVHLATHSRVDRNNPLRSVIYFAAAENDQPSDYQLEINELYGLALNSELVTLSSCETGIGKEIKGKGIQSLSNAFSYAGVSATVMSLWKVPDKETSQIMVSFYKHLADGVEKDVALRNAKLDYLKTTTDPALRHPYYWAGFVISGDTSPMQASTPIVRDVVLGVLILIIIALGVHRYYWVHRKQS